MASPLSTAVSEGLKEHYKPQRIKEMVYKQQPLLALMPKYTKFGGENMPIPIVTAGPQRRSVNFSTAKANTSTSTVKQFLLTRAKDYSFASIEHEAIKASRSDADAFLRYATMEIDGAIHSLKRSIAVAMYRDQTGSIGNVGSISTGVITLANPEEAANFEVGMVVEAYDELSTVVTESKYQKPDSGDQHNADLTVTAVDRSAGTVTVSGTSSAVAAGDALVQKGDLNSKIHGLEAWCPGILDSFNATIFGTDRTSDTTRLGGCRSDGSAKPIEEALVDGLSLAARNGGGPTHVFMDFASYANLEKALGSKVVYSVAQAADASVGFQTIKLHGPSGTVDIVPDINCQPNVAWALQLDTWSLNSLDEAPHILDLDGNSMLREASADAYEVRVGFYGNVACVAPGWNCRIKLA